VRFFVLFFLLKFKRLLLALLVPGDLGSALEQMRVVALLVALLDGALG
jgi:hypothetical protein